MAVNNSNSIAAFSAADRWYIFNVSKIIAGFGPCALPGVLIATILHQAVLAIRHALPDLFEHRRSFRQRILVFDRALELVLLLLHQLKYFFDRRIALTEGHVRPVVQFAVLNMHM